MIDIQTGATAILMANVSALSISVLIIVTIRMADYEAIRERLSPDQYGTLYNGTLLSIILGFLPFAISILLMFFGNENLFIMASALLVLQLFTMVVPAIYVLLPFKNKKTRKAQENYTSYRDEMNNQMIAVLNKISDSLGELLKKE